MFCCYVRVQHWTSVKNHLQPPGLLGLILNKTWSYSLVVAVASLSDLTDTSGPWATGWPIIQKPGGSIFLDAKPDKLGEMRTGCNTVYHNSVQLGVSSYKTKSKQIERQKKL